MQSESNVVRVCVLCTGGILCLELKGALGVEDESNARNSRDKASRHKLLCVVCPPSHDNAEHKCKEHGCVVASGCVPGTDQVAVSRAREQ